MLRKKRNNIYYFLLIFLFVTYSCGSSLNLKSDDYLNFIRNNKDEVRELGNYIYSKNYHNNFSEYKITKNVEDSLIVNFYKKYQLLPFIYSYPPTLATNDVSIYDNLNDSCLVFVKPRKGLFKSQYNLIISFKKDKVELLNLLNVYKVGKGIYVSKY